MYSMNKLRIAPKNIIKGQISLNFIQNQSTLDVPKNLKLNKCLVVSKLSRYEFERNRHKNLSERELANMLYKRGTNYEKLLHFHNLHKMFEKRIVDTLLALGIESRVVNRYNYNEDNVEWADIIFPTGGDGTFLLAASKIHDNVKPVVGFNSDPHRSEGHLCLPKKYSNDIAEAVERLRNGYYDWLLRSRIRTTLFNHSDNDVKNLHEHDDWEIIQQVKKAGTTKNGGKVLPFLALNEIFIGEYMSARVSHLEISMNNSSLMTNMKCSGLCICTGTGSTSWNLSINRITPQSVSELMQIIADTTNQENIFGSKKIAEKVADSFNNHLLFASNDKRMAYTIRDLISVGVWPKPKGILPRGFATKLTVKSYCFDAGLVIDGGLAFSFNDGTVAVLEIYPEDALRTVIFKD